MSDKNIHQKRHLGNSIGWRIIDESPCIVKKLSGKILHGI